MPKITFMPMNQTVEAAHGETILDAAITHDIPLAHACGGFCACTTCQVRVISAPAGALSPQEDDELDRLEAVGESDPKSRLGCQTKVLGDVTVEIVNED